MPAGSILVQTTGTNFIFLPGSTLNMFPMGLFPTPFMNQLSMAGLSLLPPGVNMLPPGATLLPPAFLTGAASPLALAAAVNPAVAPGASFLLMAGALTRPTAAFLALTGMTGPFGMTGSFPFESSTTFPTFGSLAPSTASSSFMTVPLSAPANIQTGATATGVLSASELNIVLDDLKALPMKELPGRDVSLPEDLLAHINIVPKNSTGNAGMLKSFARNWPELLRASEFQGDRERMEVLVPKLAEQAKSGQVNSDDLQSLIEVKENMQARLASQIQDASAPMYIRAKRFLDDLQAAVRVLRQRDVAKYFDRPRAKTVRELAQHMIDHDLRFAPAVAGDEAAYLKFYQALATYDVIANRAESDNVALKND
jgi:hypothetical protein